MRAWKYHGLGNDFVLVEDPYGDAPKDPGTVRKICDRHFGIGADGILYLGTSREADCSMRILNSDGSEAEMCGNGIRCLAKHVHDLTPLKKERMTIDTLAGTMVVDLEVVEGQVRKVKVDMGPPRLDCRDIPMDCEGRFIESDIDAGDLSINGTAVSMGNPHFITFQELSRERIGDLGPIIEGHRLFPSRTNVEFASITEKGIEVRIFERGAGWTLACGTGACATTVAAAITGRVPFDQEVCVSLPGGDLWIMVPRDLSAVYMTGPAERVFEGETELI